MIKNQGNPNAEHSIIMPSSMFFNIFLSLYVGFGILVRIPAFEELLKHNETLGWIVFGANFLWYFPFSIAAIIIAWALLHIRKIIIKEDMVLIRYILLPIKPEKKIPFSELKSANIKYSRIKHVGSGGVRHSSKKTQHQELVLKFNDNTKLQINENSYRNLEPFAKEIRKRIQKHKP